MNNEDLVIIFHLKEYLNSLIEQGTDKIFYDTLFNDEKTIDCINALNNLIEECSNKNQIISDLQKYDCRKIKITKENKIQSPSFTKEQLDLMNLGIALYIGIPKILEDDNESEVI